MDWILNNIQPVLIVSGVLTFSMISMMLMPRFAQRFVFGEAAEGRVADLVSRSWGEMVAASGLMLLYAAWHPETRLPILLYSIAGKTGFIVLTLSKGYRTPNAVIAMLGDAIMIALFAWYLLAA
ncbi:MAG TPA: hypothetical protein VMS78_15890 [Rhizomicrobium sp.]|nr:hypothetical protein [Rhizomicrobium sp.]